VIYTKSKSADYLSRAFNERINHKRCKSNRKNETGCEEQFNYEKLNQLQRNYKQKKQQPGPEQDSHLFYSSLNKTQNPAKSFISDERGHPVRINERWHPCHRQAPPKMAAFMNADTMSAH
jgi:hypothetical protein